MIQREFRLVPEFEYDYLGLEPDREELIASTVVRANLLLQLWLPHVYVMVPSPVLKFLSVSLNV